MLGFSVPKILLLLFIITIVWYGFKIYEKSGRLRNKKIYQDDDSYEDYGKESSDLELCEKCGEYCEIRNHVCKSSD